MKPYFWHVRIYYEDTDAGGVVYYANYLKFMERARTEWLRSLGVEQDDLLRDMNVLFAVRSVNMEYKRPARFNDSLCITVEPFDLKRASISFRQMIIKQDEDESVLAVGKVNVACLQAIDFSPKFIPQDLFRVIERAS